MQDLSFSRYGAQQGREPSVLHHLQLLRFSTFRPGHQVWFHCPDWKEKEDAGLSWIFVMERWIGRFYGF